MDPMIVSARPSIPMTSPGRAVVSVDGLVEPAFSVVEMVEGGLLGERSAILAWRGSEASNAASDAAAINEYRSRRVSIRWEIMLSNAGAVELPFLEGWFDRVDGESSGERETLRLVVRSQESMRLDTPAMTLESATLEESLATASLQMNWPWNVAALDQNLLRQPVPNALNQGPCLREQLTTLAQAYGLVLRGDVDAASGRMQWRWIHADHGPVVSLNELDRPSSASHAEHIRPRLQQAGSTLLIGETTHRVEGTFTLRPGWDPALEGSALSEYDRSTSTDFALVRNVFRSWVLNEDGAFSGMPFDQPAFDARAFFDDPLEPGQPLQFGSMLSDRFTDGENLVRVEFRLNTLSAWTDLVSDVVLDDEHAALRLVDEALPPGFAAAGNAGTLELRITATLRGDRRHTRKRLVGNPLAAAHRSEAVDLRDLGGSASVGKTSRFHSAVRAGSVNADESNPDEALGAVLNTLRHRPRGDVIGEIIIGPVDPGLHVGDRIERLSGEGWPMELACGGWRRPWIQNVRHRLDHHQQTHITLSA